MKNTSGKTAIILGYGQIGSAVARTLLEHGWRLRIMRRGNGRPIPDLQGEASFERMDRDAPGALNEAMKGGADAVIDTIAYTAEHGAQCENVEAFAMRRIRQFERGADKITMSGIEHKPTQNLAKSDRHQEIEMNHVDRPRASDDAEVVAHEENRHQSDKRARKKNPRLRGDSYPDLPITAANP